MSTRVIKKVAGLETGVPGAITPLYVNPSYRWNIAAHLLAADGMPVSSKVVSINTAYLTPFLIAEGRPIAEVRIDNVVIQAGKTVTPFLTTIQDDGWPGEILAIGDGTGNSLGSIGNMVMPLDRTVISNGEMIYCGIWADGTTAQLETADIANQPIIPILGASQLGTAIVSELSFLNLAGPAYANGTAPVINSTNGIWSATEVNPFLLRVGEA